jgi:hypothetical protein
MQVMCMGCRQPVEVDAPVGQEIINRAAVSMVVVEHPEQAFCPNCNAPVAVQIAALQGVILVAVPVPPAAQKRLVVVPGVQ